MLRKDTIAALTSLWLLGACATRPPHFASPVPACIPDRSLLPEMARDTTSPTGGVFTPPHVDSIAPPHYPRRLRDAGIGGTVYLSVVIDTAGHPERESLIILCATDTAFVRPASESVLHTTFLPASISGRFVRARVEFPMRFGVTDGLPRFVP